MDIVTCSGRDFALTPGRYWHLAHPTAGFLLHNTFLYEGLCPSISDTNRMPGLVNALSPYAIKVDVDAKEQVWEQVRLELYPHLPSRRGAIFLFDYYALARRVHDTWFPGEQRYLLEARIINGSRVHRADATWLDSSRDHWTENARHYWSGKMAANPRPELLVDGAVYFPGWREPPFGLFAGLPDTTATES